MNLAITVAAGIENDLLVKQMKIVRTKKAASIAKAKRPQKALDESQRKEVCSCNAVS